MQGGLKVDEIVAALTNLRVRAGRRARLVGISGIDGSGKGYVSAALAAQLADKGVRVALVTADGWLNLPHVRFAAHDSGEHFYSHAFRFQEMFSLLIDPLVRDGSILLLADYTEETATCYRKHVYQFTVVDVVLLEGIFLFKTEHQQRFDLRIWVNCSFQTALERAVRRSQEGLLPADTIAAYERIYFPAQRLHFERDMPCACADFVYENDTRARVRDNA
jgi:uridine kinase